MGLTISALVLRDSFPNTCLKIGLQGPALPQIAENTQQYYPEAWALDYYPSARALLHSPTMS